MTGAYKLIIQPVSQGAVSSASKPLADANQPPTGPKEIIVLASDAQIKAVLDYLGFINAGTDTSAVETAVNALT